MATSDTPHLHESLSSQDSGYLLVRSPNDVLTLDDVTDRMKEKGIVDVGLILGIDFTLSNNTQGQNTFAGRSLHDKTGPANPYQQVICTLGETLGPLDDDGIIPAYGFGDSVVTDTGIFPLLKEGECKGFGQVLKAYNEVLDTVELSSPTNFAPVINEAVSIVKRRKKFHILVIVADGQVNKERDTINAIKHASSYPLSIVTIGVGDGPWNVMHDFCDKLPPRTFDNFHFVDFNRVRACARNPETAIAIAALEKVPRQYEDIKKLGLFKHL